MKRATIYEEMPGRGMAFGEKDKDSAKIRREVNGGYVLEADGSVGFAIGPHDSNAELVIDPSLSVSYATFLGGAGSENANSIALDSAGNVYVGGTTSDPGSFSEAGAASMGPGASSRWMLPGTRPLQGRLHRQIFRLPMGAR
jgi:Beta-propeller repeat